MEGPDYIGLIPLAEASPAVTHDRWLDAITRHPEIVPQKVIRGVNPFTRSPLIAQRALVVSGGEEVGEMSWSQSDQTEISIFAHEGDELIEKVEALARAIGIQLGVRYEPARPSR